MVECQLPKLDVEGSNPFARYCRIFVITNTLLAENWLEDYSEITLVINEFMAKNDGFIQDERGDFDDWLEIYNYGDHAIDIGGMYLTDSLSALPSDWERIPDNNSSATTIPPHGYLLIWADNDSEQGPLHVEFALSAGGERIRLYDAGENLIDEISFGQQEADESYGRFPDANDSWLVFSAPARPPTPGKSNEGAPVDILISEIMYHPYHSTSGPIEPENILEEYIELFNSHPSPVDLSSLYLTDNPVTQPVKHQLGPLSFIAPDGCAVFIADDANEPGHVDFKLSADGEIIGLFDAELNEIDKVIYGPQTTDVSEGRAPDGSDDFEFFELPTPGVANPVTTTIETTTLVPSGATVLYYVPTDATDQDTWMQPEYSNLGSWQSDTTALGFGVSRASSPCLARMAKPPKVAYNDCLKEGGDGTAANVTDWTIYNGYTDHNTGKLKDFATGSDAGMPTVTFTMGLAAGLRVSTGGAGGDPVPGTDAYEMFGGGSIIIVDFTPNLVSYGTAGWWAKIEFTGLDPTTTYTFVGTAIRESDYPFRISLFTISDVTSCTWNSSLGVGGSGFTAELQAGDNCSTGYVVRWDDIVPGPDGDFTIMAEATPGSEAGKAYPFGGFMLQGGLSGGSSDLQDDMLGFNASLWSRIEFDVVEDPGLKLRMKYDDGFVAYLNGVEVTRDNFTGTPMWDSVADSNRQDDLALQFVDFDISDHISDLRQGLNVLAIHGLNDNANDPNFLLLPELVAVSDPNLSIYAEAFALLDGLRITELMYHAVGGSEYDYIELQNIGDVTLDVNGVRFTDGVEFTFPASAATTLDPGEYVVVVSNLTAFESRYGTTGINVAGDYSLELDNGGEDIVLTLYWPLEAAILRFEYDDAWYPLTDGGGFSLVIRDPTAHPASWDQAESWDAALLTPGAAN